MNHYRTQVITTLALSLTTPLLAQHRPAPDQLLDSILAPVGISAAEYDSLLNRSAGPRGSKLPALVDYQTSDPDATQGPQWKSALSLGAMASSGNTRRRNVNAAAEAQRRNREHRTTAKLAWNYAQQKGTGNTAPGTYELEQRHTQGSLKQDYFITDKSFLFVGADATNDYDRNLALRLNTTTGYGVQLVDTDQTKYAVEIGIGYYSEESRIANTPKTDYATCKVVSNLDIQLSETWQVLSTLTYLPSLESRDELSGISDTRLRGKMSEGMFAQLQWIVDYDNTPLADASGNPNTRVDHQIFLSVGWTF